MKKLNIYQFRIGTLMKYPPLISSDSKIYGILIHTIKLEMELIQMYSMSNNSLYIFTKNNKNVYSLNRIESIRHNCSPIILFDKTSMFTNKYFIWVNSYNFLNSTNKEPTVSYLHWHSLPVLCLSFSTDGSYLLSGGHECVLVKWLFRKSEPTFRPRLGAPIIHVTSSNDQTFYACTHSDNTLHLIGSNLSIQRTIGGINHMFLPQQASLPAGIHAFNCQQALVMKSGKPDYLQFTSSDNGKLLYNLDIVGENYVSPNEIAEQCIFTDIKRLTIDPTDTWLVTFEERSSNTNSDDHQNERKLRFWKFLSNE
ncbi:unnamed protein product [Rotaria sordida]|uniref:WD repeat-containing protein 75 second beta-propeller domain-containing protein n=1 Tax=Rotaria sordida TaxID=392033 RepID=A0A815J3H2_9BILA|nr:unnamed protein product [Rotaria sordida]